MFTTTENVINETQKCGDCGGSGKSQGYCGCPGLTRKCSYCSGTGKVPTLAAREEHRRQTQLRYTQADFDTNFEQLAALRKAASEFIDAYKGKEHQLGNGQALKSYLQFRELAQGEKP